MWIENKLVRFSGNAPCRRPALREVFQANGQAAWFASVRFSSESSLWFGPPLTPIQGRSARPCGENIFTGWIGTGKSRELADRNVGATFFDI